MRNLNAALVFSILVQSPTVFAASPSWATAPAWARGSSNQASSSGTNEAQSKRRSSRDSVDIDEPVAPPFAPGSRNLALDVGQVFLMGDLGNSYSDSLGVEARFTYGVSEIFGFDASIGRSGHSDSKFTMTSLKAGLRTNLSWYDKVIPYFSFGLGFYRPSYQVTLIESISPILFGIYLGPGVDLQVTDRIFFGAGLTFHDIFGNTELTQAGKLVEVGGVYTTFLLHAGMTF